MFLKTDQVTKKNHQMLFTLKKYIYYTQTLTHSSRFIPIFSLRRLHVSASSIHLLAHIRSLASWPVRSLVGRRFRLHAFIFLLIYEIACFPSK